MSKIDKEIGEIVNSRYVGLVDAVQGGWFNDDSNELYRGFEICAEDVVLDFGCGEGAGALFAAKRGAHVILADIDRKIIDPLAERINQETTARTVETLISDSMPLRMANEYVTRVVCMEVLEHLDDPLEVLSELVRVGRPGARYLLSVPGALGERIQQRVAPASYYQKPNHIQLFEREDFTALVEKSGLIIEEYSQGGFFWVMWMNMFWAIEDAGGNELAGPIRDKIIPPFDHNLDRWASLWLKLICTPQGRAFKEEMDALLPKNQVILARKAG